MTEKTLEKVNKLLELVKEDTVTPKDLENFIQGILLFVKNEKEDFQKSSQEQTSYVESVIQYIETKVKEVEKEIKEKVRIEKEKIVAPVLEAENKNRDAKNTLLEIKKLLEEVRAIKATKGEDGKDGQDGKDGVDGKDGKDGSPDTGENIVDKINALSLDEENKIDASHIKNLPQVKTEGIAGAKMLSQLLDVNLDGVEQDAQGNYILGGGITDSSTNTLTNKTLDDYTNFIHADGIHLRVKATEPLSYGDVLKYVDFNNGEQAIEVARRDDPTVPVIGILHNNLATGGFGMAVSVGLFKKLNTSAFPKGTILYPNATGGFTDTPSQVANAYNQPFARVVRSHAVNGEIMLNIGAKEGFQETFETVSKNLKGNPYALNYTSGKLTSIVYTLSNGTITKTLNYTDDKLTSIVLSGDTPTGINLTKTLSYTGDTLTSITYS